MKITHRIPARALEPKSAEVDPAYQREVDRATAKAERRHQALIRAQARLAEAAVRRAALAGRPSGTLSKAKQEELIRQATELVERRRAEVVRLMQLMRSAPAPAANRGRGKSKRPIPPGALI